MLNPPFFVLHLHPHLLANFSHWAHCHALGQQKKCRLDFFLLVVSEMHHTENEKCHYWSMCAHMSRVGQVLQSCQPVGKGSFITSYPILNLRTCCSPRVYRNVVTVTPCPFSWPDVCFWILSSSFIEHFTSLVLKELTFQFLIVGITWTALLVWSKH